jgi:NTE family protein
MTQSRIRWTPGRPRTVLVLGGGGMRGMAHIGVLRALERLGLSFDAVVGTSIGSLIGAMVAGGMPLDELEQEVLHLKKEDYFRLNALKLLLRGPRVVSMYQGERFRRSLERLLPEGPISSTRTPFWCNAVCLETGGSVFWGTRGFDDLPVVDAVYSSCALPAVFEPLEHGGRHFVDGGIADPTPLRFAKALGAERILAVDLTVKGTYKAPNFKDRAISSLFRSFEIAQEVVVEHMLHMHVDSSVVLIQPKVGHLHRFDFDEVPEVIAAGESEALRVLLSHPATREEVKVDPSAGLACPVQPVEYVKLSIDPGRCVGCGVCETVCETAGFRMGEEQAEVLKPHNFECTRDHACARNCPTQAIRLGNL